MLQRMESMEGLDPFELVFRMNFMYCSILSFIATAVGAMFFYLPREYTICFAFSRSSL